jgi:hypothetical protein
MAFVEAFDDFFSDSEFAVTAVYAGNNVQVIFDKAYIENYGLAGVNTFITVPAASVPGIANGQSIVVETLNYVVRNVLPDGTGILQVELEKQ